MEKPLCRGCLLLILVLSLVPSVNEQNGPDNKDWIDPFNIDVKPLDREDWINPFNIELKPPNRSNWVAPHKHNGCRPHSEP